MFAFKFEHFVNESLEPEAWINLGDDTTNKFSVPTPKFEAISNHIATLLGTTKLEDIIFVSPDPGILDMNKDYLIVNNRVLVTAKEIKRKVVNEGEINAYLRLYEYEGVPFVLAEMRDQYEYGFIFITKEDFNELNSLLFKDDAKMIELTEQGVQETNMTDEVFADADMDDEPSNMEGFDEEVITKNEEDNPFANVDNEDFTVQDEDQEEKLNLLKNPKG